MRVHRKRVKKRKNCSRYPLVYVRAKVHLAREKEREEREKVIKNFL